MAIALATALLSSIGACSGPDKPPLAGTLRDFVIIDLHVDWSTSVSCGVPAHFDAE